MSDTVIFTVMSDIVMFTVMSDTVILTVTLAAHMSRMCYKNHQSWSMANKVRFE